MQERVVDYQTNDEVAAWSEGYIAGYQDAMENFVAMMEKDAMDVRPPTAGKEVPEQP
jgi:hypothetical protein